MKTKRQRHAGRHLNKSQAIGELSAECADCGGIHHWTVYEYEPTGASYNTDAGWINLKLCARGKVCRKGNYWISANPARENYLARKRDTQILVERQPALHEEVLAFLGSFFEEPEWLARQEARAGRQAEFAHQRIARLEKALTEAKAALAAAPPPTGQSANPDSDYSDLL